MTQSGLINRCRACGSKGIDEVIDLGDQPIANNLLLDANQDNAKYPLCVYLCVSCKTIQQGYTIDRSDLFVNYSYTSSFSPVFQKHFEEVAKIILSYHPEKVVEVGSNDGILLNLLEGKCLTLGIDPAVNVNQAARLNGLEVWDAYIEDAETKEDILEGLGPVDVVFGSNVFAHIADINQAISHVANILTNRGVFIFEVQYVVDLIKNNYFDMIYHEHYFYWSVTALRKLLARHGLFIRQVEHIDTHGGSIRVYADRLWPQDGSVEEYTKAEEALVSEHSLKELNRLAARRKKEINRLLDDAKVRGEIIVGYGAPAKGNTLLNYCGITNETIDYIIDDAPSKQGQFAPGSRIKIKKMPNEIIADYVFILAWNYAEPIITKLKTAGYKGNFIVPLPSPQII